ncbi:MAG: hypothetical protein JWM12_167 [Ilumatobacteraceae bacterium]|jgi:hypothetical protein|nr:hypothetical protein [Ilumatobacteraceae bacterium]
MILQLEVPVTEPTLMIVPWHDPVVDAVGFDARSTYVELFWLNVLGPTATWLLRRLVSGFDRYPLGYELDLDDTARALGLGYTLGTSNPFIRALNRCVLFGVAQPYDGGLAVRRRVPPVAARHLLRMPESLRATHRDWIARPPADRAVPDGERARVLAGAMCDVGDQPDAVERQLLALGVSPRAAVAYARAAGAREDPIDPDRSVAPSHGGLAAG